MLILTVGVTQCTATLGYKLHVDCSFTLMKQCSGVIEQTCLQAILTKEYFCLDKLATFQNSNNLKRLSEAPFVKSIWFSYISG